MQDPIDQLRRQKLIIDLLTCILANQIHGPAEHELREEQGALNVVAVAESTRIQGEIENLIRHRNGG